MGAVTARVMSGLAWQRVAAGAGYLWPQAPARRIVVETAGDIYLIPPDGEAGAGTLFFTAATPGMQFDQQHQGIGTSTTAIVISQA